MVKQAIKKKEGITKTSVADIRARLGMKAENAQDLSKSSADKEIEWFIMPKGFQDAVKLAGIPRGITTIITGWSDTGKSSIKNCAIASAMKDGVLVVIYETENNFDFKFAIDCGMKATPIYGDVEVEKVNYETGEISIETERKIIDYEGDFIYYNSNILAEQYGDINHTDGSRNPKKKRKQAVIEDIAYSMNEILDLQDEGVIQQPILFVWDSVGSIPSYASVTRKIGNSMYDAKAVSEAFGYLVNNRIPSSKNISSKYTNSFICVNKIWNDSINSISGLPSIELKNGKTLFYSSRLIFHCGGVSKASTKKLTATAKGQTYRYGTLSKLKVTKNQLPTPYNISYEGEIALLHNGIWSPEDLDLYKKEYLKDIIARLQESNNITDTIEESDVTFDVEDSE